MAGVAGEVEGHVLVGEGDGLGRRVHRMDQAGAPAQGVDGETAGVAEHIEDPAVAGKAFQQGAVVALIHEEAGFLAAEPIDVEAEAVFHGDVAGVAAYEVFVDRVQARLVGERGLGLVVNVGDAGVPEADEGLGQGLPGVVHAGRVGLKDGGRTIDVHHQAGEEIALAVHEPECVVVVAAQAQGAAHPPSVTETRGVESGVDAAVGEIEDADGDGADLPVSDADDAAVGGLDTHQVALLQPLGNGCQRAGEDPGMETVQGLLFAPAQAQYGIFGGAHFSTSL